MKSFVTIGLALGVAAGGAATLQSFVDAQETEIRRDRAVERLLANPIGPAFLQAMAPSLDDEHWLKHGAVAAIFAPGTSDEYIEYRMNKLRALSSGLRYELNDHWGGSANEGERVDLTYSFPPDGTNITQFAGGQPGGTWTESGETESSMFSRWNPEFTGGEAEWKGYFRDAFDRWEELTANRYTEVIDDGAPWPSVDGPFNGGNGRGDIRITSALDDGAGGTLAFNFFPDTGDMLLDSGDLAPTRFTDSTNDFRYLRNVIMHEHGHGLGLSHSCPSSLKLMAPFIQTGFDGPQVDDRLGAQKGYGDTWESNNTTLESPTQTQTGIQLDPPGTQFLQNLSIHSDTDVDYFRVSVNTGSAQISATASPVTGVYDAGPQVGSGCTGSPFLPYDPSQGVDLQLEITDNFGTPLAVADINGLGSSESLNNVVLGTAGTYHIRVQRQSLTAFNDIQGYSLAVLFETLAGNPADITGDGCVDGADLALLLAQWGVNPLVEGDINQDGVVDGADLAALLAGWAPCP